MGRKNRKKDTETPVIAEADVLQVNMLESVGETVEAAPEPEATLSEIEDVVATIEALEGEPAAPVAVIEPEAVTEETETTSADFDTVMAQVTDEDVDNKLKATVDAIAERKSFEKVKDASNDKIQKYLDSIQTAIGNPRAARLMCATNVNPDILNRQIHEGNRYNVYAMGKLADAIRGLTYGPDGKQGTITNAINLACMKSLFRFRAAGVPYTGEMAKASASDKIRVDRAVNEMLIRHTVASSTAPTQASSTMQALETLGVVNRTGSTKNSTFVLTSNPIVAKLEAAVTKIAA